MNINNVVKRKLAYAGRYVQYNNPCLALSLQYSLHLSSLNFSEPAVQSYAWLMTRRLIERCGRSVCSGQLAGMTSASHQHQQPSSPPHLDVNSNRRDCARARSFFWCWNDLVIARRQTSTRSIMAAVPLARYKMETRLFLGYNERRVSILDRRWASVIGLTRRLSNTDMIVFRAQADTQTVKQCWQHVWQHCEWLIYENVPAIQRSRLISAWKQAVKNPVLICSFIA